MKKFFCRFVAVALALAFVGCSNEDLNDESTTSGGGSESKDAVYMNVTVQLPVKGVGSRSQTNTGNGDYGTSTDGTEVGLDHENVVNRVLLVLADKDNAIIASALNTNLDPTSNNGSVTSTHKISKTSLSSYYGNEGKLTVDKSNIKVYVFCNPTTALVNKFNGTETAAAGSDWVNETATLVEGEANPTGSEIWGGSNHQGGFLMSTASATDINKVFPINFSAWDSYTSADNAFNLSGSNGGAYNNEGSIRVERAVARFDFKDGSEGDNTYKGVVKDDKDQNLINIRLTKMALVNMSKQFYYLRRVSADGTNTNATLCGAETSDNYVVDWDAAAKKVANLNTFAFSTHFNYCLGSLDNNSNWTIDDRTRDQWYTSDIATVLTGTKDNESWGAGKGDYRIWRYVTENTIPKPEEGNIGQRHGISTGIVFKGKMVPSNPDATDAVTKAIKGATGNSDTDPILYAHGDNLFVRWTQVRDYAIEHKVANPEFYKIVFGTPQDGTEPSKGTGENYESATYSDDKTSPDYKWNAWYNGSETGAEKTNLLKDFKQAATSAQFTLYQSSKENDANPGYYCYYYYWNRHNDNGNNGVMGPMEFAVVRNNVYKLAVTKINRLGHPRISENDPDPEDPDNPDESSDVYLKLSVQVLPWVVRENNIVF